jgi:acetoin utilization deacetylase AcuC-like enzyme
MLRTFVVLGLLACPVAAYAQPNQPAQPQPAQPQPDHPIDNAVRGAVKVFYSDRYVMGGHSWETTRKSGWVAASLRSDPIPGVTLVEPRSLTESDILKVHHPAYVDAVKTGEPRFLAESQEFTWDPALFPMVLSSNGGAVEAALTALKDGGVSGSLSSGLHHAKYFRGDGFCTFNGLALAAEAALEAGAKKVLILDLDAHFGGGTHSLIATDPRIRQVDISTDPFDRYQPLGENTADLVRNPAKYLATVKARLAQLANEDFDLLIYNAGMDPYENVPIGGLAGITKDVIAERERIVFDWAGSRGIPTAFVLAGGYLGPKLDEAGLVDLHRLTIDAASRAREAFTSWASKLTGRTSTAPVAENVDLRGARGVGLMNVLDARTRGATDRDRDLDR